MKLCFISCLLVSMFTTGVCNNLSVSWTEVSGTLTDISVGPAGVWGINSAKKIYYRAGTYSTALSRGSDWVSVPGGLKQLHVGTNIVWGINDGNNIYFRAGMTSSTPTGCDWVEVAGLLSQLSVSSKGHVWGIEPEGYVYYRVGASLANPVGDSWRHVDGKLVQISVGGAGVWGIGQYNTIKYRKGTFGDPNNTGTEWEVFSKRFKYVYSGANEVVAFDLLNDIYRRKGISARNPSGTEWEEIESPFKGYKKIATNGKAIWTVDVNGKILARLLN